MIYSQIFDIVNIGIVILDEELKVVEWNRWMENHGRIPREKMIGSHLFDFYPNLDTPSFMRNFKSVFKFGNFAFFSQKLHQFLFPFKPANPLGTGFGYMQQSCTMAPLRDEDNTIKYVFIMVNDVTDVAAYQRKLIEMNIRDSLTGIYNRRYLISRLAEEIVRYDRYRRPFSIIIQDIDYFKIVNDTYGHQAGDQVLKAFADLVMSKLRSVDIFARYGGEEFCCLLPETHVGEAARVAESLRKGVERCVFSINDTHISITISQGVAELYEGAETVEMLLSKADDALYRAKESGRNKVVLVDAPDGGAIPEHRNEGDLHSEEC